MKRTILEQIESNVALGKDIPTAVIEYNFDLPKNKFIKKDSFFGVKASFNEDVPRDTCMLTYKM